jgi:hypothetical protein
MLSRIFGSGRSDFETYVSDLVRKSAHGVPTKDEMQRDYRAATVAWTVLTRF